MPEVEEIARKNAAASGGSFTQKQGTAWKKASSRTQILYIQRAGLHLQLWKHVPIFTEKGDFDGIDKLEKELLSTECTA